MSRHIFIALSTSMVLGSAFAAEKEETKLDPDLVKQCILNEAISGDGKQTLDELRAKCADLSEGDEVSALDKRKAREEVSEENRNVLTPHKRNYILPVTYSTNPNHEPFRDLDSISESEVEGENLDNVEIKYQLSLKVPVYDNFSDEDQALYFAFTMQSYWQYYNDDISSPFRETNYEPEIFWVNYLDPENVLWGDEMAIAVGISHQSNGRSQPYSRSWNRIYANFMWEQNGYVLSFKPWFRIPEDEKEDPLEAKGDDNPDIEDYLGFFEFTGVKRFHENEFSFMFRNNLQSDNRGAIQLDWSFPIWGRLRGYAQYFNGYGESLIDYNHHTQRLGVGILLTDLL